MATFVLVFFALFFIFYYLNARITTVPEFLERCFDRRSRVCFSGLTMFSNVVVDTAATLLDAEQIKAFAFNAAAMERQLSLSWWQDYRLYRVVLTVMTLTLVIAHW